MRVRTSVRSPGGSSYSKSFSSTDGERKKKSRLERCGAIKMKKVPDNNDATC